MGKKSKQKRRLEQERQQHLGSEDIEKDLGQPGGAEESAIEEAPEETTADETTAGAESTVPTIKDAAEPEEKGDGTSKPPSEDEPKKVSYALLIIGLLVTLLGFISVVGLRLNFVQTLILGIQNPYSGIGRLEPQGHIVGIVFFAAGIVTMGVWGWRAPAPEPEEEPEPVEEAGREVEEKPIRAPAKAEPAAPREFGHEHLPPHHLSAEEKIEHLAKAYAQGKVSKGLYEQSLAKFEEDLGHEEAKKSEEEKALEKHLPPHHLTPEEKIAHLTEGYHNNRITKEFFEKNLTRFEEELKKEQAAMPPHHLGTQEKINHLEDAYRMGGISKGTFEKNLRMLKTELDAEKARVAAEEDALLSGDLTAEVKEEQTIKELYSLLEDIEEPGDEKKGDKKKKNDAFEEKILKEIEDLENL
ncbi:MAG: hypothetical protein HZB92_02100 [Euryarchaeota archaeon]|nr:hypothetical protein [Euryarchaeota archaeon]